MERKIFFKRSASLSLMKSLLTVGTVLKMFSSRPCSKDQAVPARMAGLLR